MVMLLLGIADYMTLCHVNLLSLLAHFRHLGVLFPRARDNLCFFPYIDFCTSTSPFNLVMIDVGYSQLFEPMFISPVPLVSFQVP
jgi:hypothetical protein